MIQSLRHRGPDETGIWSNQSAALGIARLSIIDVINGHQPVFSSNNQVVAVLNGEIYNFRELSKAIRARGVKLNSSSDAEVIPHLYEEYGTAFVNHLRGMFAIALWDNSRHRLVLARDRAGKKPLVFRRYNGNLMFASEARALLASGWRPRANLEALNHVLAFGFLPEGVGAFEGLESVPPGHLAIWENGELALDRYWAWTPQPELRPSEIKPALKEALEDAVRIRMNSERPFGAFLSGGVDSSIVTALMVQNHPQRVKTFSIGFEDKAFDESPYSTQVARYLGTDHTNLQADPDPELLLTNLVNSYDQPLADPSSIPTLLLCELSRQHVVVALSGDGGDEAFGGYERYLAAPALQRVNPILAGMAPITRLGGRLAADRQQRKLSRILGEMRPRASLMDRYRAIMTLMTVETRSQIWTPEAREQMDLQTPEKDFEALWHDQNFGTDLWRMRHQDMRSYLPGDLLVKVDIASMSHSLEVRSPFLDQDVLHLAASLNSRQLVRHGKTKWLLREIASELLPPALMQRRKQGFGVPIAKWIRGPLREVVIDTLLGADSTNRHWFRADQLEIMLRNHMNGKDLDKQIWSLVMIELWAKSWL